MIPIFSRLKEQKCPKCAGEIRYRMLDDDFQCRNPECRFVITQAQVEQVMKNLEAPRVVKRLPDEADNLALLNNFDQPVMSEDYSDSPPNL